MQPDFRAGRVIRMYLEGVGLRAPGLDGWAAGSEILARRTPYVPLPIIVPECELLPPAERRRAVPAVRLALAVANEATQSGGGDRANLATIFTSSAGDSRTLHEIMQVLTTPQREVSPTRFHNSVHNAPAGYWHIASGCREPSTSISCNDASFVAGLLEAAAQIATEGRAILLVAYDLPYPAPLDAFRPIRGSFAMAFHLTPTATTHSLARLDVELVRNACAATSMDQPVMEDLRVDNPAARSLPVLSLLARCGSGIVQLDYVAGNAVKVSIAHLEATLSGDDEGVGRAAEITAIAQ